MIKVPDEQDSSQDLTNYFRDVLPESSSEKDGPNFSVEKPEKDKQILKTKKSINERESVGSEPRPKESPHKI